MTVDPDAPLGNSRFPTPRPPRKAVGLAVPVIVGGTVAGLLWQYGVRHLPTGVAVNLGGFSNAQSVKSWLATGAIFLAVVQVLSAQAMYGKLPGSSRRGSRPWVSALHRWSGRAAFLAAVPVAAHCIYALGVQTFDTRTTVHSVAGCFFFGVFATKMLALRVQRIPNWALPLFGGLLFTALFALWVTSALWFFSRNGIHY
ncbi:DUF6529 family protein [Streptomyces sp. NPDC052013]|uniref:DUF6529 family protein n=1 Tax=Streptomyces sp. NPDC052013 TaxID=3365679 RepID=UPI0037D33BEB